MRTLSSTQIPRSSRVASGTVFSGGSDLNAAAALGSTLVIAYGNPLRGDDGLGWHVAQALIEARPQHIDIIVCHQLMPELAEVMARAEGVVFVDASLEVAPGQIRVRDLEPVTSVESFTHHLEPAHLLALARALYGRAPRATLISVGVTSIGFVEALSPEVEATIPDVLKALWRTTGGDLDERIDHL